MTRISLTLALLTGTLSTPALAGDNGVPYPEGYRDWHHVKSMLIEEGHDLYEAFGGIHHLYANEAALEGYQAGSFPDGAVIVFDLLEAEHGGNAVTEGPRKILGVMQKHSEHYAGTGGWGFEGFAGGDRSRPVVGKEADKACFQCHTSQRDHDYVFSRLRE